MPDTVLHVQGRHVRRCVVNAAGNLQALVVAALNAQVAGRGDDVLRNIMGARIISAAGDFAVSNPDGTGTLTIPAASVPYSSPAVNFLADTVVDAVALGVEVYYTGDDPVR
jgi:hypothetical protein